MMIVWERKFLEHITACREAETVPIGKREHHLEIRVLCLCIEGVGIGAYSMFGRKCADNQLTTNATTERILAELSMAFARVGPNITAVACLLFLVLLMPNSSMLRPGPIFAAMNVFLALRVSLMMIHETIAGLHHINVSFERVTEYLLLPEFHALPNVAPGSKRIRKGDVVLTIPGKSRWVNEVHSDTIEYKEREIATLSWGCCVSNASILFHFPLNQVQMEAARPRRHRQK